MDELDPIGMNIVEDDLNDKVAIQIRGLNLQHGVPWAQAIGNLVLETYFYGDVKLYKSRGKKHLSLRALAKRKDLGMSRQTLSRAIGVAVLCKQLPKKVRDELELQQGYALLQVPAEQVKEAAEQAVEEHLDPDAIAERFPSGEPEKPKKPAPFGTTLRSVKKSVSKLAKDAASWAVTASPAKVASTRKDLQAIIDEAQAALAALPDDTSESE